MPGKLKKLAMPKREEISIEELEIPPPEGGEEMATGEDEAMPPSPLADVSDEDLMAELKKRGLMGDLAGEEAMAGEEELESEDEDEMDMYA